MQELVTVLPPDPPSPRGGGVSSALPPDLQEQVRKRLRVLALLLMVAFAFDPLIYLVGLTVATIMGLKVDPSTWNYIGFPLADLAIVAASAVVWWVARRGYASPSRLHTLGLVYQIVICFQTAVTTMWQWSIEKGVIPPLTWVPTIIILFPLIMPGPPRRMLVAAIAAAATSPLALMLLDYWGKVDPGPDDYFRSVAGPALAVGFAYMGARVVYRLGREVAAARELGSYRLEKLLGQGGMGEVWQARHRMLARPAAIKLIRPGPVRNGRPAISEDAIRRFEREAQVIARLRSPHTVNLFDFGVAENGAFYYVMELLEGFDADALVRRFGPVPAERCVYLLRQVCHSLSEAESCGLVHRDIKPANIFLCRYGEDCDFVKVLDFGLVKAFDEPGDAGPALTRENHVHGTPAFIAPEQAQGRSDLDARVDIYATGCVAYWMLTGHLVFTSETPMGYLVHHAQSQPTPPSLRGELSIPPELERLVMSCLAKDPGQRPQSARELSRRLDDLDGLSAWTEERAREWWARHQPAVSSYAKG
jgi:eukaryotic-like serine/threonine-protein kinase